MLFTTLDFFIFLPVAVVLFHVLPPRLRLPWLMLASLGYYASFGIGNLGYLGAVAAIALLAGRHLLNPDAARRRLAFWAGTLGILGLMGLFKYYDALVEDVAWLPAVGMTAPAGFSFYAFTAIALLADRYRSPAETGATAGQDMLYLAWFPKILAGPIERIQPFTATLASRTILTPVMVAAGSQLILWGLFKKVVVADNLSPFVDRAYAIPDYAVPMELIIATYFFAFQIYCDFSGYTDIARGSSRLFGIKLSENFRRA
jgi:alginate O-acetyltransferase complex protein AlgI